MRKLVIILAVFVLLFVAVLVWGVARDRDPPEPGVEPRDNCNGLPQKVKIEGGRPVIGDDGKPETEVDTDKMEDWKRDCIGDRGKSFEGKGRGIKLNPASITISSGSQNWAVPPAKDGESAQQVKLSIASPALVMVEAFPANDDIKKQSICLCSGQFDRSIVDKCDADWRKDKVKGGSQNAKPTCTDDAAAAKLFFGPLGGTISLRSLAGSGEVTSAR